MKKLITLIFTFIVSISATAASQVYKKNFELIGLTPSQTLEIFLDIENTCSQNCLYYMPSVKESKILEYNYSKNHYFTWTHIVDVKNAKFFSEVVITENENQIEVSTTQVSFNMAKELSKATGLPSAPIMNSTSNNFKLTIQPNNELLVQYQTRVSYPFIMRPFAKQIRSGLIKAANAVEKNLKN